MKASAVIGANYGDEGKGATVHHLCMTHAQGLAPNPSFVVRFNGGPQAGHTVHAAGKKHIFSSYGSGTLAGIPTFLTQDVLLNPLAALKERASIIENFRYLDPKLIVHPGCDLISPWDVALNQFLERGRGDKRHGSCGMGIGETQLRRITPGAPRFQAKDMHDPKLMYMFCSDIRGWFKKRVAEEADKGSFTYLSEEEQKSLLDLVRYPTMLTSEMYKYIAASPHIQVGDIPDKLLETRVGSEIEPYVIFEGAQGLLLDEDDTDHQPHVTWSKTGLHNVVKFCKEKNISLQEIYYVTRPYLTRHGAGPMHAGIEILADGGEKRWGKDATNKENEYQQHLRYGHMNWSKFQQRVRKDVSQVHHSGITGNAPYIYVAMTCMDQAEREDTFDFITENKDGTLDHRDIASESLPTELSTLLGHEMAVMPINGLEG